MQTEVFYNLLNYNHLLNDGTVSGLKNLTEEYPLFDLGWMLYLKNLKIIDSPEYLQVLKEVAIRVPDRKLLYNFLNTEIQKKAEKPEFESFSGILEELEGDGDEESKNPLIDNFLKSKPGKIRNNVDENSAESENRSEVIEKSDTEDDELITETLAKIFLKQKKYEKAIGAYQKLSLKYPEKSIYFAAQIENIEKLKNTNS